MITLFGYLVYGVPMGIIASAVTYAATANRRDDRLVEAITGPLRIVPQPELPTSNVDILTNPTPRHRAS